MNNERRSMLLDVNSTIDEAIDQVNEVIDEEQEAYDCLPEGFQYSSRGDRMLEYIARMEDAIDGLYKMQDVIEEIAK